MLETKKYVILKNELLLSNKMSGKKFVNKYLINEIFTPID